MNIMYLTAEGFDTPNPNNQLAMTMIEDFLQNDIDVYMVSSRRKRINQDIPDILKDYERFSYNIVDRPVIDKSNFIKRYIEESCYAFKAMRKWIKYKNVIDIALVQSCPTVIFSVALLKIFLRKPVIYSIFDVFPGSSYDIGVIKKKIIYYIMEQLQKLVYIMSTKIIVISSDMKKKVLDQGVKEDKIRVIPNWYDESSIMEIEDRNNKFIKKYNLDKSKFYVQFAGTIGYVLDYKLILSVAELLKDETNILFQIIGDGNTKNQFIKETKERKLINIVFYPLQPLEILADVYSACSICFIPLKKGVIGNGVPSKAPLLMACRRVILNSVEEDSDYYKMFNENNIGYAVSNSPIKIAEIIRHLYLNQDKLNLIANNAMQYGKKFFARKINTNKFISVFKEVYR